MVLEEENAKLTVAAVSQLTFGGKGWGWEKRHGRWHAPSLCREIL